MKTIISYNVNGIRAAGKKGFFDWLQQESPDIICLQETKAQPQQLDESFLKPDGYHTYWYSAEKKGYSGVALFTKEVMPRDLQLHHAVSGHHQLRRAGAAQVHGQSEACAR